MRSRPQPNYLFFQSPAGETLPCSSEGVTVELIGQAAQTMDPEVVQHAAQAVLHYYKHDLGRDSISVGEFAEAMEKVLRALGLDVCAAGNLLPHGPVAGADLRLLAVEAGENFELAFFPKLRGELCLQLCGDPTVICFTGLRECVKQLTGARRWDARCRTLSLRIVNYLRDALKTEARGRSCTLVVK